MKDNKKHKEQCAAYYQKHKEEIRERHKEYNRNNKEKRARYAKEYRKKNHVAIDAKQREWRENNKNKVNEGQRRRRLDPHKRLIQNLRNRLSLAVKHQGSTKDSTTMKLTGCDKGELIAHLESQFTEGMTWDNYGEWHIDHIRPCVSFDLNLDGEQKKCFNYNNLQPLWARDNIIKSDNYDTTTEIQ